MSSRILRPGLVAIHYMGKIDIPFRGAVEKKKYPMISTGDIVLVSEVTAISYCRGTQWERVESELDLSNMLNSPLLRTAEELSDDELLEECKKRGLFPAIFTAIEPLNLDDIDIEVLKDKGVVAPMATPTVEKIDLTRQATLENLNDLNEAEIKAACKKHGIKIGRTKTEDLIPLLIPFLQEENQA